MARPLTFLFQVRRHLATSASLCLLACGSGGSVDECSGDDCSPDEGTGGASDTGGGAASGGATGDTGGSSTGGLGGETSDGTGGVEAGGTGGEEAEGSGGEPSEGMGGATTGGTDGGSTGGTGGADCSDGAERSCYSGELTELNIGSCKPGTQTCTDGNWDTCEGEVVSQPETCDGVDDDCDGFIDEGCTCVSGSVQDCYSGPDGTVGEGECELGTQTCVEDAWGPCVGDEIPSPEVCDGLDNNCDGEEDDVRNLRKAPKSDHAMRVIAGECFGESAPFVVRV